MAYDGMGAFTCHQESFEIEVEVIIPPPKLAVPGLNDQRNAPIESNFVGGRMGWQAETNDNILAVFETQIGRWKMIIGGDLKSGSFGAIAQKPGKPRRRSTA